MSYKVISHAERMNNRDVHYKYDCKIVDDFEAYVPCSEVVGNRICKNVVKKLIHPQDTFRGFKVSDFTIENLTATGAIGNLTDCKLDGGFAAIDNCIKAVNSFEIEK